jgi:hypothetical protein
LIKILSTNTSELFIHLEEIILDIRKSSDGLDEQIAAVSDFKSLELFSNLMEIVDQPPENDSMLGIMASLVFPRVSSKYDIIKELSVRNLAVGCLTELV